MRKMITDCDAYGVVFASVSDAISEKAILRGQIRRSLSVKYGDSSELMIEVGGGLSICVDLTATRFTHSAGHPPQSWTTSC